MRFTKTCRVVGILTLGLLVSLAGRVEAQQVPALRIGYTDHEILISNMPEYRQVQEDLQAEFSSSEAVLQQMAQDLQGKMERYQRQQALLSEERRAEREQELVQDQEELQRRASEAESDLAQREADLLSPLFARVDEAIKKVSEERNLDLVLRIQAGPAQPIILYANEDRIVDITLEVAVELGIDVSAATSGSGN